MFELNQRHQGTEPARLGLQAPAEARCEFSHASFLVWGEHCVECAAPSCYKTCSLYEPRPDLRCRRFELGPIVHNDVQGSHGAAVEVRFKTWGKIESRGNIGLVNLNRLRWMERISLGAASLMTPFGRVLHRVTGDIRWSYFHQATMERICRHLQTKSRTQSQRPEYFLLEVINPSANLVKLQLILTRSAEERRKAPPNTVFPSFRKVLDLPSGYSCHFVPYGDFVAVVDDGHSFDVALIPDGESTPTLVFMTADFVRMRSLAAAEETYGAPAARKIKCVVWDLDNTLWHGTLAEGDSLRLRDGIVELLHALDQRGILLSIASKNNENEALTTLERFGIKNLFLYPQISWSPKGQSLRTIAKSLNIGIDSLAFVDDNPFELQEVSSANPEVQCILADMISTLATDPRLQGSASAEARQRRLMYKETIERQKSESNFGGDYLSFLRSCEIVVEISAYKAAEHERVAELAQRTNQLNFSGKKYTLEEFNEVLSDANLGKFVIRCSDKFGSYGTVGFSLAREQYGSIFVQDFMLSCRVQSKFIEQAFFHWLRSYYGLPQAEMCVNFRATAKNVPAAQVLDSLGFSSSQENAGRWRRLPGTTDLRCDFIMVNESKLTVLQ